MLVVETDVLHGDETWPVWHGHEGPRNIVVRFEHEYSAFTMLLNHGDLARMIMKLQETLRSSAD